MGWSEGVFTGRSGRWERRGLSVWGCLVQRGQDKILKNFQEIPRGVGSNRDRAVDVDCAQGGFPVGLGSPSTPQPSVVLHHPFHIPSHPVTLGVNLFWLTEHGGAPARAGPAPAGPVGGSPPRLLAAWGNWQSPLCLSPENSHFSCFKTLWAVPAPCISPALVSVYARILGRGLLARGQGGGRGLSGMTGSGFAGLRASPLLPKPHPLSPGALSLEDGSGWERALSIFILVHLSFPFLVHPVTHPNQLARTRLLI